LYIVLLLIYYIVTNCIHSIYRLWQTPDDTYDMIVHLTIALTDYYYSVIYSMLFQSYCSIYFHSLLTRYMHVHFPFILHTHWEFWLPGFHIQVYGYFIVDQVESYALREVWCLLCLTPGYSSCPFYFQSFSWFSIY